MATLNIAIHFCGLRYFCARNEISILSVVITLQQTSLHIIPLGKLLRGFFICFVAAPSPPKRHARFACSLPALSGRAFSTVLCCCHLFEDPTLSARMSISSAVHTSATPGPISLLISVNNDIFYSRLKISILS